MCRLRLESVGGNDVIKYISTLKELKLRLLSFNKSIMDALDLMKAAYNFYSIIWFSKEIEYFLKQ